MPPKKTRASAPHRDGASPPAILLPTAEPDQSSPAPARPLTVIERLRRRRGLMGAKELAEELGYDNWKKVYSLPIDRFAVGEEGERGIRFDPITVADFLERRRRPAPAGAAAAFVASVADQPAFDRAGVAALLGYHEDAHGFLGLPPAEGEEGEETWAGPVLAAWLWLRVRPAEGGDAD